MTYLEVGQSLLLLHQALLILELLAVEKSDIENPHELILACSNRPNYKELDFQWKRFS